MKAQNLIPKTILIAIIVLSFSINLYSQWNFNMSLDQAYNDNPFRLPEQRESWISSFNFGIQKQLNDFFVNYDGSYNHFEAISERNFYWHQLQVGFGSQNTHFGLNVEQRLNQTDFNVYNYSMLTAYFNQQFHLAKFNWAWSNSAFYSNYSELSQLNNWELNSNLRVHRTFPSRTTLMGGTGIYFKKYTNSEQAIAADTTTNPISTSTLGNGRQGSGGMGGTGGRRQGMIGNGGGYFSQIVYADFEVPSITQIRLWGRLAQSLTATTGIAVQYNYQNLLSESARFVTGISYNYNEESQIFDDPMGYKGSSIGGELTQLLFGGIIMKGAFYYRDKQYVSQGIYADEETYNESILRSDISKTFSLNIQRRVGINFRGGSDLILKLSYQWIDNQSNSYWYEYSNQYISLGFEFQF
jgi:hypothetical protein